MSNSVVTKSWLYQSVFSFPNISFPLFTTTCVEVKFMLVKKLNNMNVKQVIYLQTWNNSL